MNQDHTGEVYVWDPFVRIFHWILVVTFTLAFLTEDDVHVWAGYTVALLIALRLVWGFIGPKYARFHDFIYSPKAMVAYVRGLFSFHSKRYIGHSPGGGGMIVIILLSLVATVASGITVYGIEEHAGPLAGVVGSAVSGSSQTSTSLGEEEESAEGNAFSSDAVKGLHEFFANLTLALVIVHIGAVLIASLVHRENLIKAMITGYKRR